MFRNIYIVLPHHSMAEVIGLARKRREKWCYVCGRKIKGRGVKLSDDFIRLAGIKNPEYWYVHKECVEDLKRLI